ncbi:MAG: diaminopimelate epimerase [Eubacteriales bacterium]|nr:diaminopimelate epimerase [Eubacteriales bacterium]MDD4327882.1 diaminopimelate epimerase [Eubacteriales bacterium]MDD4716638.1 diaminopimelate epimerase [Eubacteriales bacterium]
MTEFVKMHGTGNDYVYIDCFDQTIDEPSRLAVKLSDRHFGIGGDGIILIRPSDKADCFMDMYNADGSRGKMCGNGIRCVARYLSDNGIVKGETVRIDTLSGIKILRLNKSGRIVDSITVDMGRPVLDPAGIPVLVSGPGPVTGHEIEAGGIKYKATFVSMGNPHAVLFVSETSSAPVAEVGKLIENNTLFPEGANVEFIKVIDRNSIAMRVWERGSGETLACGTGACASVVASVLNGYTDRKVTVHLLGGDLYIEWDEVSGSVYMTGEAVKVFSGHFDPDEF